MRKNVMTYKELGFLRIVKRDQLFEEVSKYYPNSYRKESKHEQITFFNYQRVNNVTTEVMVAHAYACNIKKLSDNWYFQMILPPGVESREEMLLREYREKQQPKPKKKFVLRLGRLKELYDKRKDPFFDSLPSEKERDAYFDSLPEKEIHRRQDLCNQQLSRAHDQMNNKALARLSVMEDDLTRAMSRR